MKQLPLTFLAASFLSTAFAAPDADSLIGKPISIIPGVTLSGIPVDQNYYKGHVTLVTFMYIGCPPCMNEIGTLNRLHDEFSAKGEVQILCIARQMRDQMVEFNGNNKSVFSQVRRALGADSMRYAILPACPDAASKAERTGEGDDENVTLKRECNVIEDTWGISSYPTALLVDKKGIVRKVMKGGPGSKNSTDFYEKLKVEIMEVVKSK